MRKKVISILFLATFILNITPVYASTKTYERSEYDYLISSDITVTEYNKDNILNTPAVDASEKVYDFADLFTTTEETDLYNQISDYIATHNLDLAVVTIDDNNKLSPQEYADDFYDYNDFGINSTHDGVLFLIDMDNREIYMSTTGNAIEMYNDYRIDSVLDVVYQYMTDADYYEGVTEYIEVIGDYAKEGLPTSTGNNQSLTEVILISLGVGFVATLIIMFILIRKNRLVRKATTAKEYLNKESVVVNNVGEVFLGSNTVKHKIERSSSSGSSTHSGSSGRSHGGGGRGF